MKNLLLYITVIIAAVMITGCEGIYNDAYRSDNPNVYVVGYEKGTSAFNAIYWKNGAMKRLTNNTDGTSGYANSVFVYKGKAYIALRDAYNACYSIDGNTPVQLTGGTAAHSVFVYNNDIYIAGYYYDAGYNAMIWKNGLPTSLNGGSDGTADSVFVSNGTAYISGQTSSLVYWEGVSGDIKPETGYSISNFGNSSFVFNGEFYIPANNDVVAYCLKDGSGTQLDSDGGSSASAKSVFVYNGDVYVAGYIINGITRAVYWKNGQVVYLTDGTYNAYAFSIFVYNGDVYVAGWESNSSGKEVAKYWKNGEEVILTSSTTKSYAALSIFVSGE